MDSLLEKTKNTIKIVKDISYPGPSMLSTEEKAFYFLLGSEILTLEGVIVDAGCWLGSSSFYLGKGVEQNARFKSEQIIYACDIFQWDKNHDLQLKKHSISLQVNDDFQFLTKRFLETLKIKVYTRKIDYSVSPTTMSYHTGEPIEALMIDAGKSPELLFNILEGYLPYCIEDKSIIFFQDYRDYWCWFIPPIVSFLDEIMEPVIHLNYGGSGFRFRNKAKAMSLLKAAKQMFKENILLEEYYNRAIKEVGNNHREVFFQMSANKVALFLHLHKVTEVYYGPEGREKIETEDEAKLTSFFKALDQTWPSGVLDTSLQNAYRRIRHAITGTKDLSLTYKSPHYYKRRIVNPIYAKIALKKALGR